MSRMNKHCILDVTVSASTFIFGISIPLYSVPAMNAFASARVTDLKPDISPLTLLRFATPIRISPNVNFQSCVVCAMESLILFDKETVSINVWNKSYQLR